MQDDMILKFQNGNKDTYREIFNMLYPGMCLFARKFIADCDDAEDIVQEMFIELWHQRVKFDSINHIKAFLYLSIKNKCLNNLKHHDIRDKHAQSVILDNDIIFEDNVLEVEVVQNLNLQ